MKSLLEQEMIKKIAEQVTRGFIVPTLPRVKDIAWAFPIHYNGYTGEVDGELLNGQECNAWATLTLLDSYMKTLEYSRKGEFIQKRDYKTPPVHISFEDPIFDSTHLHWNYQLKLEKPREDSDPEPLRSAKARLSKSVFWDKVSKSLAASVVLTDKLRFQAPFASEDALASYLTSVRGTLEQGSNYLKELVSRGYQDEPVLTRVNGRDLQNREYTQLMGYSDNKPLIYEAFSNGVSDGKLKLDIWVPKTCRERTTLDECLTQTELDVSELEGAHFWKIARQ
jgi:hypothetical protein